MFDEKFYAFSPLLVLFQNYLFSIFFRNTIRVSNSLDPGQARLFVGPDLGPNCLQTLSADNTSRQLFSIRYSMQCERNSFDLHKIDLQYVSLEQLRRETFQPIKVDVRGIRGDYNRQFISISVCHVVPRLTPITGEGAVYMFSDFFSHIYYRLGRFVWFTDFE